MTTRQIYKEIDQKFTKELKKYGLAYNLRKVRNLPCWRVQIGKFEKITDPYWQGEICPLFEATIKKQFKEIFYFAKRTLDNIYQK